MNKEQFEHKICQIQTATSKTGKPYFNIKVENGYLSILPCIPKNWKEYQMQYKWQNSIYKITVKNPDGKNIFESGTSKVTLNGNEVENHIKLDGSRNEYEIEVRI